MDSLADDLDVVRYFNGRPVYLDRSGQPMTLRQWGEAYEDAEKRLVARTEVGDAQVITMWMGLDADPISNPIPLIFGSIIRRGASWGEEIETATEAEAMQAHQQLVYRVAKEQKANGE
jgi:hypothetical protein